MQRRPERTRALSALYSLTLTALVGAALVLQGCASSAGTAPRYATASPSGAHESLVLPSTAMLRGPEAGAAMNAPGVPWEFWRNNGVINYQPNGAAYPHGWSETYTRDRFYTFGGRIHEHSRFEIRSYRVR